MTEAFLAKQLGGRFQPVGDDFKGSTITVPTGAENVPGLVDALEAAKRANDDAEKTSAKTGSATK